MVSCVMNSQRHAREISPPNGRLLISLHPPFESERLTPFSSTFQPSNPQTCPRVLPYLIYFHRLAHSFALFCTHKKHNPLVFNRFRTLRQKTRGGGYPVSCARPFRGDDHAPNQSPACPTLSGSRITSHLFGYPHHCGERPLVQQSGKAQGIFTIRGNNSAPPGV
jgi:hypothetical protein